MWSSKVVELFEKLPEVCRQNAVEINCFAGRNSSHIIQMCNSREALANYALKYHPSLVVRDLRPVSCQTPQSLTVLAVWPRRLRDPPQPDGKNTRGLRWNYNRSPNQVRMVRMNPPASCIPSTCPGSLRWRKRESMTRFAVPAATLLSTAKRRDGPWSEGAA